MLHALPMSALGQKGTLRYVATMSALVPKADIDQWHREACFMPECGGASDATRILKSAAEGERNRERFAARLY